MSKNQEPKVIFDYFTPAKVVTLATLLRRMTAIRVGRLFSITLVEWRIITSVGANPDLSFAQLGARLGLSKAQISRAVSGLVDRGIVKTGEDAKDARKSILNLTPEGIELHNAIVESGKDRHGDFLQLLSKEEMEVTNRTLDKLIEQSRVMLEDEKNIERLDKLSRR